MTDVDDDGYSFEESLSAKLAALDSGTPAETEPEAVETVAEENTGAETVEATDAEPEPVEQPRDEAGRFLPKFTDPEVQEYLAKYGGDVGEALKAATHAYRLIGRRDDEREEMKRQVEELRAQMMQVQARPQGAPVAITQDLIDNDPGLAVQVAFEQGNEHALRAAFSAWEETEPTKAAAWFAQQLVAKERAEMQAEIAQIREQIAPVAQRAQTADWEVTLARHVASRPNAETLTPHLDRVAQERPWLLHAYHNAQDDQTRLGVIDSLFDIAEAQLRGRNSDTLAAAQAEAAAKTRELDRQAKTEAQVASAATARETRPKTSVDIFKEQFREFAFSNPTSIQSGLTYE